MSIRKFGFLAGFALLSGVGALGQTPPPNDNFTNATVLTGTSITLTGTLAGATYETPESNNGAFYSPTGGGSVWWSWTAPLSSTVVIAAVPSSFSASLNFREFSTYTGGNLNSLTPYGCCNDLFKDPPGRYIRFSVTAGTTYHFRMEGTDPQPFSLQLTATNPPVFIFHPQDCAVSPFDSAFFSAMATGPARYTFSRPGTTYQWFFNETPIPGQVYPSLLVHGVTINQVGTYSVIASNVGGVMQGGSAMLTLVDTNPVPRIVPSAQGGPSLVSFGLTGEPGRFYQIDSSQDLQNWVGSKYLLLTNGTATISVPRLGSTHFVRASLDVPTDVCIAQLKQMRWAVHVHAIEQQLPSTASYTLEDIRPYVPITSWGSIVPCPEGATYSSGATVLNPVTCNHPGHVLVYP